MRAIFVIDLRGKSGKFSFSEELTNPGVGGSEAYIASLAILLKSRGLAVGLGVLGKADVNTSPNMPVEPLEKMLPAVGSTLIVNSGSLDYALHSWDQFANLVVVSHHPYDANLWIYRSELRQRRAHIVSLGSYQYASNRSDSLNHLRIPGLWPNDVKRIDSKMRYEKRIIGFVGSLHPSKGLHDALKIVGRLPPDSFEFLQVIGGEGLYADPRESPTKIPIGNSKYRRRIERLLEQFDLREKVQFEGVVEDIRPFLSNWRFAILNPRGFGEADSQTLKELLSNGVPTFASRNFGLSDFTESNPKAALGRLAPGRDSRSILSSIESFESFENLIRPMNAYVSTHKGWNEKIIDEWTRLLDPNADEASTRVFSESESLRRLSRKVTMFLTAIVMRAQFLFERRLSNRRT